MMPYFTLQAHGAAAFARANRGLVGPMSESMVRCKGAPAVSPPANTNSLTERFKGDHDLSKRIHRASSGIHPTQPALGQDRGRYGKPSMMLLNCRNSLHVSSSSH